MSCVGENGGSGGDSGSGGGGGAATTTTTTAAVPRASSVRANVGIDTADIDNDKHPAAHKSFVAGGMSGVLAASVTQPLDVVKTRMQAQRVARHARGKYTGIVSSLRLILAEEGGRGLFVGLAPSMLALVPALSLFFATYTSTKKLLSTERWMGGGPDSAPVQAISAGTAWSSTALLTNPLWLIRTRMITQILREGGGSGGGSIGQRLHHRSTYAKYSGVLSAARMIVAEEGVRGLYRGTLTAMAGFPGSAVQFPLYERFKHVTGADDAAGAERLWRLGVSSSLSSVISQATTFPLEVLRTRVQSGIEDGRVRALTLARRMLREEGARAFYRGLMPSLVRTAPNSIVALVSYEVFVSLL